MADNEGTGKILATREWEERVVPASWIQFGTSGVYYAKRTTPEE